MRIRTPVELELGDEFVVGDQLLRIEKNPVPDDGPDPDPTYFYSSPKWPSSFRVVQIFEGGAPGACVVARGNTLQIGSAIGDLVFPDDPLVAEQHCVIEEQAGSVVLTDLGTRTGVFVRIRGEQELAPGDELLVGRTRLVVDVVAGAESHARATATRKSGRGRRAEAPVPADKAESVDCRADARPSPTYSFFSSPPFSSPPPSAGAPRPARPRRVLRESRQRAPRGQPAPREPSPREPRPPARRRRRPWQGKPSE